MCTSKHHDTITVSYDKETNREAILIPFKRVGEELLLRSLHLTYGVLVQL